MKKHFIVAMVTAMIMLLTACGGSGSEPAPASSEETTKQASVEEKEAGSEDKTEDAEEEGTSKSEENKDAASAKGMTFEKVIAIDNDECAITINEIDEDDLFGFYSLKTTFENKSAEKTYMYSVETAYVNGVESDPFFATEVNPGKKANQDISFNSSVLEANGVGDFTDIEITFNVYNTDDVEDNVARETIHIYPYGEENALEFKREAAYTDIVLADDENMTIIITGCEKDDEYEFYMANLYVVNKTDKKLMYSVEDASINGYMADPFFATDLDAGKCCFTSLSWPYTTLDENGIDEVEEITVHFQVYDCDNYENSYLDEEYTINP